MNSNNEKKPKNKGKTSLEDDPLFKLESEVSSDLDKPVNESKKDELDYQKAATWALNKATQFYKSLQLSKKSKLIYPATSHLIITIETCIIAMCYSLEVDPLSDITVTDKYFVLPELYPFVQDPLYRSGLFSEKLLVGYLNLVDDIETGKFLNSEMMSEDILEDYIHYAEIIMRRTHAIIDTRNIPYPHCNV